MKKVICLIAALCIVILMGAKKQACCAKEKEQCQKQCENKCSTAVKDQCRKKCAAMEKAILETHDQIIAAAEKLDAEAMFSYILDNDKGAIAQEGQLMTRQEALEQVKQAFSGTDSLKYDFKQRNIKMLSPTIALMISTGTTTSTMSSQSFTSTFANTTVFVLQDDGWKIIHGHHSIPNFE